MRADQRADRGIRLRVLLRAPRGALRRRAHRGGGEPRAHRGRPALALALPRLPALRAGRPDRGPAGRPDAPRAGAPPGRAELGLGDVWVKNDTANPTHSFKDRVVSVALEKARSSATASWPAPPPATSPTPWPPTPPPTASRATSSCPADLEEQKIVATAVYGTTLVAVDGVYDDVNRLCMELAARPPLGLRERERAPVLQRGLQDPGLRGRRAARLAPAGPLHRPDRLRLALHQDRPRLPRPDRDRPGGGRGAGDGRRPGRRLRARRRGLREGLDFVAPVRPETIAKSLAIGNPADGVFALDVARTTGGSICDVTEEEIVEGIELLARTTGIFTETAGGVTTAALAKLARAGRIDPDERVVALHHRRRPQDARRRGVAHPAHPRRAHRRQLRGRDRRGPPRRLTAPPRTRGDTACP